ncbi:MAG: carboxypeptidase-like regulatory domain-containing protein [Bacteroidales bacterium]|nr:carboxypeptidase-like regulatory domain-containing protein [Bacteroidales bacterium]
MKQLTYFSTQLNRHKHPSFNSLIKSIFRISLLLFLLFNASEMLAQKLTLIKGNVAGIDKVNIWIYGTKYGTTTDEQGFYELSVFLSDSPIAIQYSAIGYTDTVVLIHPAKHISDTILINISLSKADYLLPEVAIKGSTDFFRIKDESITDIGFFDHGIVLLTTTIKRRSRIHLIDYSGKAQNELDLDAYYSSIHTDCFGNLELIGSDSCLQIYFDNANASIGIIDKFSRKDFQEKLMPCLIQDDDFYLFKASGNAMDGFFVDQFHYKKASYFSVIENDSNSIKSPSIDFFDKNAYKNAQSIYNQIIALYHQTTPEHENVITMQVWDGSILRLINDDLKLFNLISWYQKIEAKPIKIEVFKQDELLYFFDLNAGKLLGYTEAMELRTEQSISNIEKIGTYTLSTFVQDEKTKIIYAVFVKNGIYMLGHFDVANATVSNLIKANEEPHPDVFKIYNGYAYSVQYNPDQRISKINRKKIVSD